MKIEIIPLKLLSEQNLLGINETYVICDIPSMKLQSKKLAILQGCSNSAYNNFCQQIKQNYGKKIIVNVRSESDLDIIPN